MLKGQIEAIMENKSQEDQDRFQEMEKQIENLEKSKDDEGKESLDTDTFSIMMTSKVCSI